jgi:hypothetical protein
MNEARITYVPRPDTSPETELSALCNVYKLIIDHANKNAAGMTSTNDTTVRHAEGVGDVGQRPD